jgi:SAM-dependent methyltransferase
MLYASKRKPGPAVDISLYAELRQRSRVFIDGLERRTETVASLIERATKGGTFRLLDIGTADGLMLRSLQCRFSSGRFVGLDMAPNLVRDCRKNSVSVVQGDASRLPFPSKSFEVVLLSATLKHIAKPDDVFRECRRVLVGSGHLLVLDPTPLGLRLGLMRGHFDPRYLRNVWTLRETIAQAGRHGFRPVTSFRYMVAPVMLPGFRLLESALKTVRLDCLFMQQAVLIRLDNYRHHMQSDELGAPASLGVEASALTN